MSTLLDKIC
ncbi:hypothetical protein Bhyg_07905 [Pseudolycoriella hygida]|uniref:Uncharacterized protein n=1 Tax=Pseudolycoriella hygida TaxID=35572 RepID=A0A9Q0N3K6_9DIPT|nr:hypothetical protein Bhyg_07905 [Pseudolycoriella hygida]